jgi:hypothetical protein
MKSPGRMSLPSKRITITEREKERTFEVSFFWKSRVKAGMKSSGLTKSMFRL